MRILIIDNYDSYTFNIYALVHTQQQQQLLEASSESPPESCEIVVIRNNQVSSAFLLNHILPHFEAVILSPGPGTPHEKEDFGLCLDVLSSSQVLPVLGVCLGHQGLASAFGGKIVKAQRPVHGQTSPIFHHQQSSPPNYVVEVDDYGLFHNIPSPFNAVRYHSLIVDSQDLPDCILPIAWTYEDKQDGNSAVDEDEACSLTSCSSSSSSASNRTSTSVIMAIQHSEKPFWGVQFHPESICSDHGNELISNFFTLARKWWATSKTTSTRPTLSSPLPSYIKALCQIPSPSISSSLPSLPNSSHKFNNPPISNYRLAFQQITTTTTNNSSSSSALPSSQLVYDRLFSPKHESYSSTPCFWLDSSKVEKGRSTRFSYMGSSDGPLSFSVSYSTATRQITKKRMDSNSNLVESKICLGTTSAESGDGSSTFFDWIKAETMKYNNTMNGATTFNQKESSISISSVSLSPLSSTIDDHYTSPSTSSSSSSSNLMTVDDIPFDFWTGFVGYFGYEMKTESFPASSFSTMGGGGVGGSHPNGTSTTPSPSSSSPVSEFKTKSNHHAAPDSSFLFIDRMIVFDHEMGDIWLVSLHDAAKGACLEEDWFSETRAQLSHLMTMSNNQSSCGGDESFTPSPCPPLKPISTTSVWDSPQISVHHSKQEYMKNITRSIEEIKCGETYEVCLTTQIKIKPSSPSSYSSSSNTFPSSSGYNIYKQLRRRNPAPYAAFLHLSPQLSIACSSPERFLKVDRENWITMKPIKGTLAAARLQDVKDHPIIMNIAMSSSAVSDEEELRRLQQDVVDAENRDRVERLRTSEKDRSENLMIVDLIRNDLTLISEPESVHVPNLFNVESYATVHQLVTTVKGKLKQELGSVDAVRYSFPPGSMTGAPKRRTVSILEDLEQIPRGAYSGALGFISVAGSAAEFNVVIRTAVITPQEITVGAGGAIIVISDVENEYEEMLLKSNSVLPSIFAVI